MTHQFSPVLEKSPCLNNSDCMNQVSSSEAALSPLNRTIFLANLIPPNRKHLTEYPLSDAYTFVLVVKELENAVYLLL